MEYNSSKTTPMTPRKSSGLALVLCEDHLPTTIRQAQAAFERGQSEKALTLLDRCDDIEVSSPEELVSILHAMGRLYVQLNRAQEASHCYERLVTIQPDAIAFYALGRIYARAGFPSRALDCRQRAVALKPDDPEIQKALALDLMRVGQGEAGMELLRQVLDAFPDDADAFSKLLLYMQYQPGVNRKALYEAHTLWAHRFAPDPGKGLDYLVSVNSERRLRIGYLSADLCDHVVVSNFEAVLRDRDSNAVELYGYGSVAVPDHVTERLSQAFDVYRPVYGLDDVRLAQRIHSDRIDILVHVAAHTQGHRLAVLGYRPAPIQVDFQSTCTTGMTQVDYRFTDAQLDPDDGGGMHSEALIYLPGGVHCYTPPAVAPAVRDLPAQQNGFITFGCSNNRLKINEPLVDLWAKVLFQCPQSRMVIKCVSGRDPVVRQGFLDMFVRHGIHADRISVIGWEAPEKRWDVYHQVDIALDTHPFSGCNTTMEGLWMGVPVVTLAGATYAGRMSLSLLHALGLEGLVADHPEQYVALAVALAQDRDRLAALRARLREHIRMSPLCDNQRYARELEQAYRAMWQTWCEKQSSC